MFEVDAGALPLVVPAPVDELLVAAVSEVGAEILGAVVADVEEGALTVEAPGVLSVEDGGSAIGLSVVLAEDSLLSNRLPEPIENKLSESVCEVFEFDCATTIGASSPRLAFSELATAKSKPPNENARLAHKDHLSFCSSIKFD